MTGPGTWTLVYDGDCQICTRSVQQLREWDEARRFEIVPYQADGVMERFPAIEPREFEESIQLIGPSGGRWAGADAVEKVLALVPRGRPFAWIFRIPFARPVARRVYRLVARNRHRLGCGEHCAIP